jgi:hypothetical protein
VRPVRTRLSNGREAFYLKGTGWKRTSTLLSPWPLNLGYKKIDMCHNFYMLYYLENTKLTKCMTCGHSRYKPRTGRGKTLVTYKKLRYFSITPRLQRLFISPRTAEHMTWHDTNHIMRLMEWWCILLMVKPGNTLTVSILTFQLNQGTCVLSCVQTDSTHSGHLLLLILVGRLYWRFITCHRGCVWGRSSCFYL